MRVVHLEERDGSHGVAGGIQAAAKEADYRTDDTPHVVLQLEEQSRSFHAD